MISSEIDVFRDLSSQYLTDILYVVSTLTNIIFYLEYFIDKHIAIQLKVYLFDTFQIFVQDFVESCGVDRRVLKLPIEVKTLK